MGGIATVKFDEKKLRNIQRQLSGTRGGMKKVMTRGINKTTKAARTKTARQINEKINLGVGAVRKSITMEKASYSKWRADLDVAGKRVPLIKFGASQTKKGLSYKIDRSGGRKKIPGGFKQMVSSGHKGAFFRPGKKRYPIVQLYGPSVGRFFAGSKAILRRVMSETNADLKKNIQVQTDLLLKKLKSRAA